MFCSSLISQNRSMFSIVIRPPPLILTKIYNRSKPQSKDGDYYTSQGSEVFGYILHHRLRSDTLATPSYYPSRQGSDWRANHISQIHTRINTFGRRVMHHHFPRIFINDNRIRIWKSQSSWSTSTRIGLGRQFLLIIFLNHTKWGNVA